VVEHKHERAGRRRVDRLAQIAVGQLERLQRALGHQQLEVGRTDRQRAARRNHRNSIR
jgi:hypothetical protein